MKRSKRTPIILKEEDISLPKSMLDHAGDPLSKESSEAYSVPGSGSIEAPAAEESLVSHPSSQGHENARGASPSIQQIRILLRCVGAFFPFTIAVPFLFSPNPDIQFLSMSVTVWGVYLCLRLLLPIPLHSIVFAGVSFLFFASIAQILMISFTFLKKYVYQFTFTTWPFLFFAYFVLGEVALFSLFVLSKTCLLYTSPSPRD